MKLDADPHCALLHANEPLLSDDVMVSKDGGIQNAFVYVDSDFERRTFEPPKEPVVLNQRGCAFVPHVVGMQARQFLLINNSDETTHNIHALPSNNPEINNAQPANGKPLKKTFTVPEVMIPIKCDLHPWMKAYIGVLDHPFFSVTGTDGTFALAPLPAGTYTVTMWHEKYGTESQVVTVGEKESKELDFVFEAQ